MKARSALSSWSSEAAISSKARAKLGWRPKVSFDTLVGEMVESAAQCDQIKKVAMLSRGRVGKFARSALAGQRSMKTDVEAASGRVGDVADDPVAALAAAIGKIVAAHRLGVMREAAAGRGPLEAFRCMERSFDPT